MVLTLCKNIRIRYGKLELAYVFGEFPLCFSRVMTFDNLKISPKFLCHTISQAYFDGFAQTFEKEKIGLINQSSFSYGECQKNYEDTPNIGVKVFVCATRDTFKPIMDFHSPSVY
jgi:hypothetical protein